MQQALALARRALGSVSPNPAVGAVVVRDGKVVGEGYTQPPGGPHAEIVALEQAGELARGADLYVTLEPCCHHGRTPPCTHAIIAAGITNVHMSHIDPDPQVSGRGCQDLLAAGIEVTVGEGEEDAQLINEAYIKHRRTGIPFVTAKFAMSLDGRIASRSGDSRWISGPEAREWAHRLRTQADALLVGIGTVLADDPLLMARLAAGEEVVRQPLRVVADSRGRTPLTAQVLTGTPSPLLATTDLSPASWREAMQASGAEVMVLPAQEGQVDLQALLQELGRRDVVHLLVEGGGALLGSFFDRCLVDKVQAVIAPIIVGAVGAPTPVAGRGALTMADVLRLRRVEVERLGEDILVSGYVEGAQTGLSGDP